MLPPVAILLIAASGVAFVAWVLACTMSGRYEPILLIWALLAPLTYCLLAYPLDRPVITLHRTVILPLVLLMFVIPPSATGRINRNLAWLAITWGCFVVGALISLVNAPRALWLSAVRVLIDSFLLPPLLAFVTYRCFRVRQYLRWLHLAICMVSVYLALLGIIEIATGHRVLSQPGMPDELYAGGGLFQVVRTSGPFINPGTYALVGMVNAILLIFFRAAACSGGRLNGVFHWPGLISAISISLMSLTRGAVIAYFIIFLFEVLRRRTAKRRLILAICAITLFVSIMVVTMYLPQQVVEERYSSDNLWGRIVQQVQTFRMFADHPITGAGFCNFLQAAEVTSKYDVSFNGAEAVGSPHNLVGEIIAETGLVGAIPFLISQVLLVGAFRKLRMSNVIGETVWRYFVMIFLAYWILNMDFSIGYYSELNLWFIFALSLLYRCGAEARSVTTNAAVERPPSLFGYIPTLSPAGRFR